MAISTDHPASYRAIPPLQNGHDEATGSDGNESDVPNSTRQWISSERWTYFLLGCAILLPWSALVNGIPFFLSRMENTTFYSTFSSYMSSVYIITKLFFLFYCTITSKRSSSSHRIYASMIVTILLFMTLWISTYTRATPTTFFLFTLFTTASLAVMSSYLCAAVYAQAALLGPSFLQGTISGQAAIAVAISIVQIFSAIISLWGLPPIPTARMELVSATGREHKAEEIATRILFGVSALSLGIPLAAYMRLSKQSSFRSVINTVKRQNDAEDTDELSGLVTNDRRRIPATEANSRTYLICKRNWVILFSITHVYLVTLAIYPAITVRVQSVNPRVAPLFFTALHFLVFNLGDLVGRHVCSFPSLVVWSTNKILAMSLLRTLFIPLILLCNVPRPGTIPPIISSDTLYMIILFAMGYTTGFVACTAMLLLSSLEHNPRLEGRHEDVDVAAALGGTFAEVGLACGALSSFIVEAMI